MNSTNTPESKPYLLFLISQYDNSLKNYAALTLGSIAEAAGIPFELYYSAEHKEGGLFAPFGSNIIGGHHTARIARIFSSFNVITVRLGCCSVFESLIRSSAESVIDEGESLPDIYSAVSDKLGVGPPEKVLCVENGTILLPVIHPECSGQVTWVLPPREVPEGLSVTPTRPECLDAEDPVIAVAQKWKDSAAGFDTPEPLTSEYFLPFFMREKRVILPYTSKEGAVQRRDQMLELASGKGRKEAYGRWYGDPELIPLAEAGVGYQVIEPCRSLFTSVSEAAVLPQPEKSWIDLEPSDKQLEEWADEGVILASWVLHSGELSHDDSVLLFQDWCAMTGQKIGAGVHWQRYHYDPEAVELMHVPVNEGGVLGLMEPILHSSGAGVMWESEGDPEKVAELMCYSKDRIAERSGERFAPEGVYCFGDHTDLKDDTSPGEKQLALWKAVKNAGFTYLISSVCDGKSKVLYRDEDFVVMSQAAKLCNGSPFYRGFPETFSAEEKQFAEAGNPGWMVGALDCPIHGSQIYTGRAYNNHPQIHEYFDYMQNGGVTGKVRSAIPHTIARYAVVLEDRQRNRKSESGNRK